MNGAQQPFAVEGPKVSSYLAFGNHDNLSQGSQETIRFFEDFPTGRFKSLLTEPPTVTATALGKSDFSDRLPRFADAFKESYDRPRLGDRPRAQAITYDRALIIPATRTARTSTRSRPRPSPARASSRTPTASAS